MKYLILSFILLLTTSVSIATNTPLAVLGDLTHDGPYDRSEILLQEELKVLTEDDANYKVVQFSITINSESANSVSFQVTGNKLPPKVQGALNQIVEGSRITIKSIFASKINDPYDIVELRPIVLEVKHFKPEGTYDSAYGSTPIKIDTFLFAQLGDIKADGTPVEKERLINQDSIIAKSTIALNYTISEFKMIVAFKDDPPVFASSNSNLLTQYMMNMLGRIKSGDRVLIEGIKAKSQVNGKTIRAYLSPIIYEVK